MGPQCSATGRDSGGLPVARRALIVESFDLRDIGEQLAQLAVADAATPIDLAIFNAGLGGTPPDEAPAETPEASRAVAEVNFLAPVTGANAIAAAMASPRPRPDRSDRLNRGIISPPMAPTYAATKAGLRMFAEALGIRLATAWRACDAGVARLH